MTSLSLGGEELAGGDFEAGAEGNAPLDDVAFAWCLWFGSSDHGAGGDPALVDLPGFRLGAGLAFQQAADANTTEPRLGEVAHHLPALAVAVRVVVAAPFVGGIDEDLHLVAKPRPAIAREVVSFGVLLWQPTLCVDAVEHVIGDLEGEVEALVVILHPAFEREVLRVGRG